MCIASFKHGRDAGAQRIEHHGRHGVECFGENQMAQWPAEQPAAQVQRVQQRQYGQHVQQAQPEAAPALYRGAQVSGTG